MKLFTSDLHFFDSGIIGYCDRPFDSVEEMNRRIVHNFITKVKNGDEIYILGDILGADNFNDLACARILSEMGIRKMPFHLILGNHDVFSVQNYLDMGFATVKKLDTIDIEGRKVMLTHDPCMVQKKGTIAICGHVHTLFDDNYNFERKTLTMNVSVEKKSYKPVSEEEILKIIRQYGF